MRTATNFARSRVGSLTEEWELFGECKRIAGEAERAVVSLETIVRGVCEPTRLLDLVENFVLYERARGGLRKLLAMNDHSAVTCRPHASRQ